MSYQKGRVFLLKLAADGTGGTLAGSNNLTIKIGNEAVDVTNKDSAGWRALLEGAGTQTVDITIDGKVSDASTYETFQGYAQTGSINGYQVVFPDNDLISGLFQITDFSAQGAHNDAVTFSASLQSAGPISFTNA